MFYILGINLSIFLALILLSKRGKTIPDKILALWLITIGAHLFFYYLTFTQIHLRYPSLLGLDFPLPFIHGPFLYFYVATLTNQIPKKKIKLLLHFLPICASYLSYTPFYILTDSQKVAIFKQEGKGWETLLDLNNLFIYLSGGVYFIWCLFLLKKHSQNILSYYSYTEKINLRWLKYLIYGMGIIWLTILGGHDELIFLVVTLFVCFIGYYGIKQVGIFTYNPNIENKKTTEECETDKITNSVAENKQTTEMKDMDKLVLNDEAIVATKKKYQKSGLTNTTAIVIHKKLSELIISEKDFKNPELTLVQLAQKLNIHPNTLSQVINTFENKNFYDFINEKRIEEFKRIVSQPQNQKYTLLALAFECGFNSKTSFNRNFKKATDLSPSEYLNNIHLKVLE